MRHFKIRLAAELRKGPIRVHAQIARIGPHIARNETGSFKCRDIGVFNRSDIGGLDLQLALNIQQRLAQRGTLAAHQIAQAQLKIVKAFRLVRFSCRSLHSPPDHALSPITAPNPLPPLRATHILSYWAKPSTGQAILHVQKAV